MNKNGQGIRDSINIQLSLKMLAKKLGKYAEFCAANDRMREGKASVLVNPQRKYNLDSDLMPLLEKICGEHLGDNPNNPNHPLNAWKRFA